MDKYKGSVKIFADLLGAGNRSEKDEFTTKGKQECLDV